MRTNEDVVGAAVDTVIRPNHYTHRGIEPIKFILSHELDFCLGNVIKYVARAGFKEGNTRLQDLKKAAQYIRFAIEQEEALK